MAWNSLTKQENANPHNYKLINWKFYEERVPPQFESTSLCNTNVMTKQKGVPPQWRMADT